MYDIVIWLRGLCRQMTVARGWGDQCPESSALVRNEGECVSSHEIRPVIDIENNIIIFKLNSQIDCNYAWLWLNSFTSLEYADIKGLMQRVASTGCLYDGHFKATVPVTRDTAWLNNCSSIPKEHGSYNNIECIVPNTTVHLFQMSSLVSNILQTQSI